MEEAIRKIILKLRQIGDITSNGVTCNNPFSWTNKNLDVSSNLNYEKIYFQALNRYFSYLSYNQLEVKEFFEDNKKQRESLVRINSNGNIVISKREAENDERVFDSYSTLQYDKLSVVDFINNKKSELTSNGLEVKKDNNGINSSILNDVQLKIENENEYSILGFDRLAIFKKDGTSASFLNANSFNIAERKTSGGWSSLTFNNSGESLLTSQSEDMGYKYDAYFPKLKTDNITTVEITADNITAGKLKTKSLKYDFEVLGPSNSSISYYITQETCIRLLRGEHQQDLYLPNNPGLGTIVLLHIDELNVADEGVFLGSIFLHSQGTDKILYKVDEDTYTYRDIIPIPKDNQGLMRMYIYTKQKTIGYWQMIMFKD